MEIASWGQKSDWDCLTAPPPTHTFLVCSWPCRRGMTSSSAHDWQRSSAAPNLPLGDLGPDWLTAASWHGETQVGESDAGLTGF